MSEVSILEDSNEEFDVFLYIKKQLFELIRVRRAFYRKRKIDDDDQLEDIILYGGKGRANELISLTVGLRSRTNNHRSVKIESRKDYKVLANLYDEEPVRFWAEETGPKKHLFIRTVNLVVETYFSDVFAIRKYFTGTGVYHGLVFIEMPSASFF
jgi:hypothetical protein